MLLGDDHDLALSLVLRLRSAEDADGDKPRMQTATSLPRPLSPPLAAASEPVLVGEIQVPPGVGPPVNAAVKKDPTIEHFHSEQLPADP